MQVSAVIHSKGLSNLLESNERYALSYDAMLKKIQALTATQLSVEFESEYNSWKNRKKWALDRNVVWHESMLSFSGFLTVNGPIPNKGWTLDRIISDGSYVPENLRWASKKLQTQNRRNSRWVSIGGESVALASAAKTFDTSYQVARRTTDKNPIYFGIQMFKRKQREYLTGLNISRASKEILASKYSWVFAGIDFSEYELDYIREGNIELAPAHFYLRKLSHKLNRLREQTGCAEDEIARAHDESLNELKWNAVQRFLKDIELLQSNQEGIEANAREKDARDTEWVARWRSEVIRQGKELQKNYPDFKF